MLKMAPKKRLKCNTDEERAAAQKRAQVRFNKTRVALGREFEHFESHRVRCKFESRIEFIKHLLAVHERACVLFHTSDPSLADQFKPRNDSLGEESLSDEQDKTTQVKPELHPADRSCDAADRSCDAADRSCDAADGSCDAADWSCDAATENGDVVRKKRRKIKRSRLALPSDSSCADTAEDTEVDGEDTRKTRTSSADLSCSGDAEEDHEVSPQIQQKPNSRSENETDDSTVVDLSVKPEPHPGLPVELSCDETTQRESDVVTEKTIKTKSSLPVSDAMMEEGAEVVKKKRKKSIRSRSVLTQSSRHSTLTSVSPMVTTSDRETTPKKPTLYETFFEKVSSADSDSDYKEDSDDTESHYSSDSQNADAMEAGDKKKRHVEKCKVCNSSDDWISNLDHAKTCIVGGEDYFKCPQCPFNNKSIDEFKSHVLQEHSVNLAEKETGVCLVCRSEVAFADLQYHYVKCRNVCTNRFNIKLPSMICLVCYEEMEEDVIVDHLFSEHRYMTPGSKVQPYKCTLCPEPHEFTCRGMLKTHYETVHSSQDQTLCIQCLNVLPTSTVAMHETLFFFGESCLANKQCQTCSKSYMPYQLADHLNAKHTEAAKQKKYKCFECSKTFLKRFKLIMHCNQNHRLLRPTGNNKVCIGCCRKARLCICDSNRRVCDICGTLVKRYLWSKHRTCHSDHQMCEICGESMHKGQIRRHKRRHERKEEDWQKCPHCKRRLLRNRLDRHIATVHKKQDSYMCTLCEKKLSTPSALKVHALIHTNEVKLTCELCGYGCKQRSAMNWHMKSKHKGVAL